MPTQSMNNRMGLGLCGLVALVTTLVIVKIGLDLGNQELPMGSAGASGISAGGVLSGEPAPELALEDLYGNEVRLTDHRGQVILVDFWATWCGPCIQELPHIQKVHEKYQDQGLVVLAISTDRQKSKVPPFVEKNGYTFPVLLADGKVETAYQVRGIPVVYLIDRTGVIRYHKEGFSPGSEKDFARWVEELLKEEAGPLPGQS